MRNHNIGLSLAVLILAFGFFAPLKANIQVQVSPSLASPQPVGTTITWTATSTDSHPNPVTYRFEVAVPGTVNFALLRDFSTVNTFDWTSAFVEGKYQISVTARDFLSGEFAQVVAQFRLVSLVVGNQPAVNSSANPLVVLFSAPTCPDGSRMRAIFQQTGAAGITYTPWKTCHSGSMNFYVAGMFANSTYTMNYQVVTGTTVVTGPTPLAYTTGSIPPSLQFPIATVNLAPGPNSSTGASVVLMGYFLETAQPVFPVAMNQSTANVLWYYPNYSQLVRPVSGGDMLLIMDGAGTGTGFWGNQTRQCVLREIDVAGNVVRETNVDRVNEQLVALGTDYIGRFHHDAIRLPNGETMVMGDVQRVFPAGTQGSSAPVDIIGDMIIVLDANFQVRGYWNAFDHLASNQLDITRTALRGEICTSNILGCPPAFLPGFTSANDWLHANSLQYTADANILMSLRDQDWVIKIAYGNNDTTFRSQNILWRLGLGGDFTLIGSNDPYPWFSGQHEAGFENNGTTVLSLFDNGTSRVLEFPGSNSRGQVLNVDEQHMLVSLQLNADLGVYSSMFGSAQQLPNGDYAFLAGYLPDSTITYAEYYEVNSTSDVYGLQAQHAAYRGWRMRDMYTPPGS